ncbi:MAG: orotidine-5'-phosphate decarboxylase [Sulfurimicrobium sp.]|jgi:orotidine-5'-phosphate decarboxylase|nr:orotidine-5'-phosphate decarboxylase [Sulfurimicrobium sp.]MDP1706044.1 orotidine-5'-phosphate decarboxylase [Sulfurimicrobium sp.]MDP1897888.1 orotidine-5'-phosphate decarboxylase [Sulfurimicrobium sp.]MDP2199035.1 orotidine-5'-phosphate decarboxylase [Sulfurimicrobium sp.]MDP3687545.1 orotidine-5'-phosphate decarboxylase [Sulfurimicrobium sp.]
MTNKTQIPDPKIIVALDYANAAAASQLVERLDPTLCKLKVGKELFTAAGPAWVEHLVKQGYGVFLDLKFHDIPHTVAQACKAAASLGVWMVNVHALGGRAMMNAAREALETMPQRPKLIAVTVLTSMGSSDLADLGISEEPRQLVRRLAGLAQDCRLDGVVCSAQEAAMLRQELGSDFCLVTPGIRPASASASKDDQKRIMTPADALHAGAHYLVIGRPITQAADPLQALRAIGQEIANIGELK